MNVKIAIFVLVLSVKKCCYFEIEYKKSAMPTFFWKNVGPMILFVVYLQPIKRVNSFILAFC